MALVIRLFVYKGQQEKLLHLRSLALKTIFIACVKEKRMHIGLYKHA